MDLARLNFPATWPDIDEHDAALAADSFASAEAPPPAAESSLAHRYWQQLRQAALQGHPEAAFLLGRFLCHYEAHVEARALGRRWLGYAATLGSMHAASLLVRTHTEGDGDSLRAKEIFLAIRRHSPGAEFAFYLHLIREQGGQEVEDGSADLLNAWEDHLIGQLDADATPSDLFSRPDNLVEPDEAPDEPTDLDLPHVQTCPVARHLAALDWQEWASPPADIAPATWTAEAAELPEPLEALCHTLTHLPEDRPAFWLARSVLHGWVPAWLALADLLVHLDEPELIKCGHELVAALAELDFVPALEALAQWEEHEHRWRSALAWWGRAATLGSALARKRIQQLFHEPPAEGFPKREDNFRELFADAGCAEAQASLARRCYLAKPADLKGAERWASLAAAQGDHDAAQLLSLLQKAKEGSSRERLRRLRWLEVTQFIPQS